MNWFSVLISWIILFFLYKLFWIVVVVEIGYMGVLGSWILFVSIEWVKLIVFLIVFCGFCFVLVKLILVIINKKWWMYFFKEFRNIIFFLLIRVLNWVRNKIVFICGIIL